MSGNPQNGAQRASTQAAGHVTPGRPTGDRRGRLIFIGELVIMAMLVGLLPNLPPGPLRHYAYRWVAKR